MKRSRKAALSIATLALALLATPALAAHPHFVFADASLNGANLVVDFREASLGKNLTVTIRAEADAQATYACQYDSGGFPADPKLTPVLGHVTADLTSARNGSVTGRLTASPPSSSLGCDAGQHRQLVAVQYSDITVIDTTNVVSEAARPSSLAVVFFVP